MSAGTKLFRKDGYLPMSMSGPEQNEWVLRGLKGELTPRQQEELELALANDTAARELWEEECSLNQLLARVPDAPVSSNFTALVMGEIAREEQAAARPKAGRGWLRFGFPRLAAGAAVAGVILFGFNAHRQNVREAEFAEGIRQFTAAAREIRTPEMPAVEMFQNFEAIQKLGHATRDSDVDMELLVALQR